MVQEMVRPLVKVIRDRKLVQELQDLDLKVASCHYTEDYLRGFTNINSKEIVAINVDTLNAFDEGAVVTVEALVEKGIIKNPKDGVKILGNGELTKKLEVKVNAFSASAAEKIQAAGGKAEVI